MEDQQQAQPLPPDLPGYNALRLAGIETLADLAEYADDYTRIAGVGKITADRIGEYLDSPPGPEIPATDPRFALIEHLAAEAPSRIGYTSEIYDTIEIVDLATGASFSLRIMTAERYDAYAISLAKAEEDRSDMDAENLIAYIATALAKWPGGVKLDYQEEDALGLADQFARYLRANGGHLCAEYLDDCVSFGWALMSSAYQAKAASKAAEAEKADQD